MTIVLDSTFATAEDTAKVLGVSKSRLKRLVRIANARTIASGRSSVTKLQYKNGARVPAFARKRKNARGKAEKAAR
jgi:hypothetical protein